MADFYTQLDREANVVDYNLLDQEAGVPTAEASYASQALGALIKGGMNFARAITIEAPVHIAKLAVLIGTAGEGLPPEHLEKRRKEIEEKQKIDPTYKPFAQKHLELIKQHKQGTEAIIRAHPEWEYEPPKNFLDLLTSPRKLSLAIIESSPMLIGAGLMTVAGAPNVAAAMIYTSEGQQAHDQAIIDKATPEEAEQAYHLYGSVATILEVLRIKGMLKTGKMGYQAILNQTAKKIAKKGFRGLTKEIVKEAGREALEEMSQGMWQEVTAKIVYGKDIPGGLWDIIDRRAQEGLIGGTMALIPGVGGVSLAKARNIIRGASEGAGITEVEATEVIANAAQQVDPKATPEKQQEQLTNAVLDEVTITRVRSRFPQKITDQASLENIGNAIAEHLGVDPGIGIISKHPLEWEYNKKPGEAGVWADYDDVKHKITINVGTKSHIVERGREGRRKHAGFAYKRGDRIFPSQGNIKRTIVHELGHIVEPSFMSKGGRWQVHHPEFVKRVDEDVKQLFIEKEVRVAREKAPEVPTEPIAKLVKPKRLTRKKALAIGHDVPEILGWTDEQRRDFIEDLTGQRSLKDLKITELRIIVDTLNEEMQKRGLIYEEPVLPTDELIETLERTKKVTAEHPIKEMNRRGINKLGHAISKKIHTIGGLLFRTERFLEGLDGHKEGVFYNTFWTPANDACNSVDAIVNQEAGVFYSEMENQDIDTVLWMGAIDKIPGTEFELTASQRIGVYTLSKNEKSLRYLVEGMGLAKKDIVAITKFMSDKETQMAEWLLDKYEAQWPILQKAAAQAGINLKTLKKEFRYAPIIRTDADLEAQEDFLSDLAEPFHREGHKPEAGMLEKRKAGAIGRIELDALVCYLHNIARVQRFITMAPLANKLSKILNNKNFKVALNDRTYGQGSKLINSWLKDVVKGSSAESTSFLSRALAIMRINGIVYAIGYNVPSSLRQTISGLTSIAIDPLMMKYAPMNLLKAMTPEGYRTMETFVYERASELQHRNMDRDIRRRWNYVNLKRNLTFTNFSKRVGKMYGSVAEGDLRTAYMYYKSGQPFSRSALRWIKFMDKHTVVVSWKSFYDTAIQKKMNEKDAIHFANKWIGRTQPMGNVQWLPQFFRDGPLEKLISTFQNFVNQFGNFYYYDIYQAKKAGEIGMGTVAHRVMWSYILPAIVFGMIGRARLPKDWKELAIDLGTYPIAPLMIIGRLIDRMIRGWGNSGTIAETGPEAAVAAGRAIIRGDVKRAIKGAVTTIAAIKGIPPTAQMIRTTEGIIDLAAGTTEDPRRLIYSRWALEQGKIRRPTRRGRAGARPRAGKARKR